MESNKNKKTTFIPRVTNERVKTEKGRKISSSSWLKRHINDKYVQAAQYHGYRSRASFKILQLHEKFDIFKPDDIVIDLGAAPGGWSQAIKDIIKGGRIIGIDLLDIAPLEGVEFIKGDFLDPAMQLQLAQMLNGQKANVIMSDMAHSTTGHKSTDHLKIITLCECAFDFALHNLAKDGHFIAKAFAGGTYDQLLAKVKERFKEVKHAKPDASRKESSETYLVAKFFK